MIRVRVGPQSIVSVRVVSGAPVRVNITGTAVVGAAEYSGPYDVIPRFSEQILLTAQRLMQKDVTIKRIPQYEVSNDYGTTLILGDEYYGE